MYFSYRPFLYLTIPAFLLGCNTINPKISSEMLDKTNEQQSYLHDYKNKGLSSATGIQHRAGIELGPIPSPVTNAVLLPPQMLGEKAIVWRSNYQFDLAGILAKLSDQTGIQHNLFVGPDRKLVSGGVLPLEVRQENEGLDTRTQKLLENHGLNTKIRPDFHGSLPKVLDHICSNFDLAWIYQDGMIHLQQFNLKNYYLDLLPTTTTSTSTIGSTTTSLELDLLSEIQVSLGQLLRKDELLISETGTGVLIVNARPSTHRQVRKYIKQINADLGQQIAIDVIVLTLSLEETQGLATALSIAGGQSQGNSFEFMETGSLSGATTLANVGLLSGDFSVDSFLSLLDNNGEVVVETRTGATTSNNRMIPIQVVREIAFAKTVESVSEENGVNLSRITPGQLSTGFEMTLLPRVLNNLEILLHYNIRISDLNELKEFTSNDQTIQLPNVATTEFEQQTILGNGETLVLAGFERERLTSNQRKGGLFSRQAMTESHKVSTIILIQPRLLKRKTS